MTTNYAAAAYVDAHQKFAEQASEAAASVANRADRAAERAARVAYTSAHAAGADAKAEAVAAYDVTHAAYIAAAASIYADAFARTAVSNNANASSYLMQLINKSGSYPVADLFTRSPASNA
jgi:hypothetical protein